MSGKSVLGRGVDALLSGDLASVEEGRFFLCDIDKIEPNKDQPRKHFDEDRLQKLAESIAEKGVIQPLLVTRGKGNRYSLIAGERRLRAALMAGLDEVPVVLTDSNGKGESLELALIENLQRHDLNPIEEAMAYSRLINDFGLTQEGVARKVGRKRSTVTNILRLLGLPDYLQDDVISGLISEGHARVLLRLKDDAQKIQEIRGRIIREDLSVRATERLCRRPREKPGAKRPGKSRVNELPASYCRSLINQLANRMNTGIRIIQNGERGKLEIDYYSSDDLDRLVNLLAG
ncbi:Chromosome (plasmid) partitioning protein ParB [hydrothermal vent metagenome]|uniref:Chromosome (Plasmid) partitioning protein ParB n=1 Tax=hydrothermal vent metagenome TaxID=652676 RepID=A0A3B0UUK6_9ZZZZ